MHHQILSGMLLFAVACHAGSITGSIAADTGGARDLTALGSTDWVHFGTGGNGGGGVSTDQTEKLTGTAIGTPTTTRGIFKFYNNGVNTYSWTDGTPIASTSVTSGMFINDGLANGFAEIVLPVAASTTAQRLVLFLASEYFFGTVDPNNPDPIATLTATLNDGSGANYTINNITGRNIVTLDFTADNASTLSVSFSTFGLSASGSPNQLFFDAVYLQPGADPGNGEVPEPASYTLAVIGGLVLAAARKRYRPE